MSRVWIGVALLVGASPLRAGVYHLDEHHWADSTEEVRNIVLRVRSASLPPPKDGLKPEHFKHQVLAETARLEALKRDGLFTTLDRVNLSACYLRLGDRVQEAIRLLTAGDKEHFLIQSNLAAAYFLSGEPGLAVRHQERALQLWPAVFVRWDERSLRRYRDCELALLRVYASRAEEASRGRPGRLNLDIDPVFPGVRYVGQSGSFEPGAIAPKELDKLPLNAVQVMAQLAVWFPGDMRLYWQLGQLLGVAGAVDQSYRIADELVSAGMGGSFKGLPQQRRALLDAVKSFKVVFDSAAPAPRGQLMAAMLLLPRPLFAPPVVGDLAYAAGCAATVPAVIEASKPPIPPFDPPPTEARPPAPVFNFTHVTMGFGFGFLVAALCGLQWQEWRRRRQSALAVKSYKQASYKEGQGNGEYHGGGDPAANPTAPDDRPPGTYRLP